MVFDKPAKAMKEEYGIDVKILHEKIRELTLENDFLSDALTKVELGSAKKRLSNLQTILTLSQLVPR